MGDLSELLKKNAAFAQRLNEENPGFLEQLSNAQNPRYLWIGCADSRVPATVLGDMKPGDVFVHRNVANVVETTDLNMLSVVQYAVEVLKVRDVIVCGHYGCGGVKAALGRTRYGLIDNWLRNIKHVAAAHAEELDVLDGEAREARLCELNVAAQVRNLCSTTIIQEAWARGADLTVHGLIYGLRTARLQSLGIEMSDASQLEPIFQMDC